MRGPGDSREAEQAFRRHAYDCGLAVYPTVDRAAATVARLLRWRGQREGLAEIL